MSKSGHMASALRVTLATLLCHCGGSPSDPASSSEALSAPSADSVAEERRHHHKHHHHHDAGVEPDAALDASDGAADAASPTDLAASVTGLDFSPECNDPPPAAQTFTLMNRGGAAAAWTATFPSYLTVSPATSTLAPGESVTISVDVGAVGTGGIIPETPGQMYTLSIETASQTIDIGVTSVIDGCLFEGTSTTVNFGDVLVGGIAYAQVSAASTSCNDEPAPPQLQSFDAGAAFQVGAFAGSWPVTFAPTTAGPQTGTLAFNTANPETCGGEIWPIVTVTGTGVLPDAGASDSGASDSGASDASADSGSDSASTDGASGSTFASISVGNDYACALSTGGTVYCWGLNQDGQLGVSNSTSSDESTPVLVPGLSNVVALAAANDHTCALVSGGTVSCWGLNFLGELGTGSRSDELFTPYPPTAVAGLTNVTSIAATDETTCAIRSDGTVWCWGVCGQGQCGNPGAAADDPNATQVCAATSGATGADAGACASFLPGATSVSGGASSFCAVLSGGTVACWGANVGSFTPVAIAGLSGISAVAVGEGYACALQSAGTIACWGSNADGQLGNGTTIASSSPTAVTGLSGAIAIAATQGDTSTCALLSGGTVQCWGDNDEGQLGNGTTTNALTPTPVSDLSQVTAISGAGCALLTTGQIECWGPGSDGQLGNGSTASYSDVPVFVE